MPGLNRTYTFPPTLPPLEPAEVAAMWHDSGSGVASEDHCLALIDKLFPKASPAFPLGRKDDCAALHFSSPQSGLALSTDFFWEHSHFLRSYFTPQEVGAKALSVAVSDLAGAGAVPHGFSLGLMIPDNMPIAVLTRVLQGMAAAATYYNIPLTGGDLSKGSALGFSCTVWGTSPTPAAHQFFRRGTAEPGDIIFLVGKAGLSRLGLLLLNNTGRQELANYPEALRAHLAPEAQIATGLSLRLFAESSGARMSMMDLSDGLIRDLPRLTGKYGANLTCKSEDIPEELRTFTQDEKNALDLFLLGGEDYALLGTCSEEHWQSLATTIPACTKIGDVTTDQHVTYQGQPYTLTGFDHFSSTSDSNSSISSFSWAAHEHNQIIEAQAYLADVCKQAWQRGLLAGFNGSASLRLPPLTTHQKQGLCLVTGSKAIKSRLAPKDTCLVDLNSGDLLTSGTPSLDSRLHLAIYAACPDTQATLHAHPPYLLALSLRSPFAEMLALPLFEAAAYKKHLTCIPPLEPGSPLLAELVAQAAAKYQAIWLQGHGLIVHQRTLELALGVMEELEQLAKIQLLALGKTSAP